MHYDHRPKGSSLFVGDQRIDEVMHSEYVAVGCGHLVHVGLEAPGLGQLGLCCAT